MTQSNTISSKSESKLNLITAILVIAGALISICLVFVFMLLFNAKSNSIKPQIYNAKQIGSTDSSVLLVWSSSKASKEFIVRYRSTDSKETSEFRTDKSFAAIHGLKPNKKYNAVVIPVDEEREYDPATVICTTSPYCNVTEVNVDEITCNSAHVTWNYDGIDEGFTVAAYTVDKGGKRHFVSDTVTVPKGSANECTLENLLSVLRYTVCVMPNTRYAAVQKTTFLTDKYSKSYNQYFIVRFTPCPSDTTDSVHVTAVTTLTANQPYKTSLILSGAAAPTDKVNMEMYVTDADGIIVRHVESKDVVLNPNENSQFFYRSFVMDFTAPSEPGEYSVFAVIDGVTVKKNNFTVS